MARKSCGLPSREQSRKPRVAINFLPVLYNLRHFDLGRNYPYDKNELRSLSNGMGRKNAYIGIK